MKDSISRVKIAPMNGLAAASIFALLAAFTWTATHPEVLRFSAPSQDARRAEAPAYDAVAVLAATSATPVGDAVVAQFFSRYRALASAGVATDTLAMAAADIVPEIAHETYTAADVATDPDTSLKGAIRYRADMRIALAPLLKGAEPEIGIYARYVESGDAQYLRELSAVAADYRAALSAALAVKVPADAVSQHVAVLNAMSSFAAALEGLAGNAADPIASIALLRTYNRAEAEMLTSFNSLGQYAAHKASANASL